MTEQFLKYLDDGLSALSLTLSADQKEQLFTYYRLVVEKNRVMNLTAITEETEFVQKHIIDSLALVKLSGLRELLQANGSLPVKDDSNSDHLAKNKPIRLIDVGTGAGLPGIVLKIAFPGIEVVLFDALQKRLTFLNEVIKELQLTDIQTLHGRAEDIGQMKEHRETYDLVVSRAVAQLPVLAEYCLPLAAVSKGKFVAYKSADVSEESMASEAAIKRLGGVCRRIECYELPGTDYGRSLILIEKTHATPKNYPRKAGTPAKQPL